MTADERIEKLLSKCGQTISDLPDRRRQFDNDTMVNMIRHISKNGYITCGEYVLHLTDVVDRMECAIIQLLWEKSEHALQYSVNAKHRRELLAAYMAELEDE